MASTTVCKWATEDDAVLAIVMNQVVQYISGADISHHVCCGEFANIACIHFWISQIYLSTVTNQIRIYLYSTFKTLPSPTKLCLKCSWSSLWTQISRLHWSQELGVVRANQQQQVELDGRKGKTSQVFFSASTGCECHTKMLYNH